MIWRFTYGQIGYGLNRAGWVCADDLIEASDKLRVWLHDCNERNAENGDSERLELRGIERIDGTLVT